MTAHRDGGEMSQATIETTGSTTFRDRGAILLISCYELGHQPARGSGKWIARHGRAKQALAAIVGIRHAVDRIQQTGTVGVGAQSLQRQIVFQEPGGHHRRPGQAP